MTGAFAGLIQFFTPTHVLALIALGLLAGQNAKQMPAVILVTFALGLVAGALLISFAIRETPAATAVLAIAAVGGIIVVVAWQAPPLVRHSLAFATGTALALNSPPQAITVPSAIAMQAGTAIGALVALAIVTLIAAKAALPWQHIGIRILGSWVAASAILVLALRLVR